MNPETQGGGVSKVVLDGWKSLIHQVVEFRYLYMRLDESFRIPQAIMGVEELSDEDKAAKNQGLYIEI